MIAPTPGRIVLYSSAFEPLRPLPAIVLIGNIHGFADLAVFTATTTLPVATMLCVPYSEAKEPNTWHWPPRTVGEEPRKERP